MGTNRKLAIACSSGLSKRLVHKLGCNTSLLHVHIDVRTANDKGCVATAIDIANLRGRNDTNHRIGLGIVIETGFNQGFLDSFFIRLVNSAQCCRSVLFELCFGSWCVDVLVVFILYICIVISIDGIGSIHAQASAIQAADEDRLTAFLLDFYVDRAINVSLGIVTSIYGSEVSIGYFQINVASDIGIRGPTEELSHVIYAFHLYANFAIDVRILAGTIGLIDNHGTVGSRLIDRFGLLADVALLVAAAIDVVNASANDVCRCCARAIPVVGVTLLKRCGIRLEMSHIGIGR